MSGNGVNLGLGPSDTSACVMVSNVQFFEPQNWSLANVMRVRGAIVLAAGVPFWIFLVRFINEVRKSPFGSEFGPVAFPPSPQFRAAQFVALVSFFVGLYLLVADFITWIKKRPNGRPR
jgi:hypothetical protein